MFVIELVYKVDLATIDAEMRAHVAWLRPTTRREPSWRQAARSLATVASSSRSATTAQIESIVREDPFVARGLADYRLILFRASQRADDLPKRIA